MSQLTVASYNLRFLLQASQELITPRLFQKFLVQSGLERFSNNLPPLELEPIATREEVANFMANIYSMMGEGVYSLFCQNVANEEFKLHTELPIMLKYRNKVVKVLNDPNLTLPEKIAGWLELNKSLPKVGINFFISENLTIIFNSPACRYCSAIQTDKMICFVEKFYLQLLLKWLSDWNFVAEQTHSTARGDPACVIRFTPFDAQ
jgi:hypothetical protein